MSKLALSSYHISDQRMPSQSFPTHNSPESFKRIYINPYKPSILFCGTCVNNADPDQTPHNAASDQGIHGLLKKCSIEIRMKMINTTQQPLKRKLPGPNDKSGKYHSA